VENKLRVKQRKRATFFPRKLVGSGGTRTLAVGRILPADWGMVKISVLKLEGNECIIRLEKLI